MTAYYNENDPKVAAWLRELIARNLIAPGIVDDRSIADVRASDIAGFAQCHFFAGIGVWSYALRAAGWADDRKVWTGSCPCQSFSAAGKGAAFDDPRHLWPVWFRLVRECRPDVVFGEQVSAAIRHDWLDLVSTDMEAEGYAIGSSVFGAHSVGAPHQRQRLYWVADSQSRGDDGTVWSNERQEIRKAVGRSVASSVADNRSEGRQQVGADDERRGGGSETPGLEQRLEYGGDGVRGLEYAKTNGHKRQSIRVDRDAPNRVTQASFWSSCDWLPCRDGKWRPVEPGTFPLAHGAPARVGRLRGYGNAIVSEAAQAFIEAYREVIEGAA